MIFFTSDQHFGHTNIIRYSGRPFKDVADMTAGLISRFQSVVTPVDTVYHLGDFSLDEKHVRPILAQLPGRHILIPGNHDACHPRKRGWQKAQERYRAYGFAEIHLDLRLTFAGGVDVRLAHLPYKGDGDRSDVERYTEWRLDDDGGWLLHGHVHEAWLRRGRMINVGVDVWGMTPVSEAEIAEIVASESPLAELTRETEKLGLYEP